METNTKTKTKTKQTNKQIKVSNNFKQQLKKRQKLLLIKKIKLKELRKSKKDYLYNSEILNLIIDIESIKRKINELLIYQNDYFYFEIWKSKTKELLKNGAFNKIYKATPKNKKIKINYEILECKEEKTGELYILKIIKKNEKYNAGIYNSKKELREAIIDYLIIEEERLEQNNKK